MRARLSTRRARCLVIGSLSRLGRPGAIGWHWRRGGSFVQLWSGDHTASVLKCSAICSAARQDRASMVSGGL